MDLDRFIQARQGDWQRLEVHLRRAEKNGLSVFTADELRDLGWLYRQASSDLMYARTVLQNAELADFLNQLIASAYGQIYQRSRVSWRAALRFLTHGFPILVRRRVALVLAAGAITLFGMLAAGGAVLADPEAFVYVVPSEYHELYGKKPGDLREERFQNIDADRAAAFSGVIFTNNIRVSFLAFAMGISYGFFTIVMLFYNGALLGAIAANFHRWEMNLDFWSLIIPHGMIEFSCIFIAGGAGLLIASAMIRPGRRPRGAAIAEAAREAAFMALGIAPFLVLAGLIEGFVTPMEGLGPWSKIAVGLVTGAAFWIYLLLPRSSRA